MDFNTLKLNADIKQRQSILKGMAKATKPNQLGKLAILGSVLAQQATVLSERVGVIEPMKQE